MSDLFKSVNPFNGETLAEFSSLTREACFSIAEQAQRSFGSWRETSLVQRSELFKALAQRLRSRNEELGELITLEMGKPLEESKAEILKCAWVCDHYAEEAKIILANRIIESDARKSYVRYDPLGVVLAIMPWNFPFWQVFRFAAPGLMAGNVCLLKHAPNVPQCAQAIQALFEECGFPAFTFSNLYIDTDQVAELIASPMVQAVTLTGSDIAGMAVGKIAGMHLKKFVFELGGSDPVLVLPDADIEQAADVTVRSRMLNSGQSCIAAKRFLVHRSIAEEFMESVVEQMKQLRVGDPLQPTVNLGPLARPDLAQKVRDQVRAALDEGAVLRWGNIEADEQGCVVYPKLLELRSEDNSIFQEEVFGPVISWLTVDSEEDMIRIANESQYGLGASIWTKDLEHAEEIAAELECGNVFINDMVKSDPRLPFGGIKRSGIGRELSDMGIREFVNAKTVYIA